MKPLTNCFDFSFSIIIIFILIAILNLVGSVMSFLFLILIL